MKYDAKEFKRYPEIMSKEQMRIACHISKRTALYLLQFNLIPHTFTGKKTRCYAIKKSDVIAFMNDREVNPEKYIAPKNWYKYGGEIVRPYFGPIKFASNRRAPRTRRSSGATMRASWLRCRM